VEQLKYHIETGIWEPGWQLPTVRELARALRINYNTARAAYQELEREGYLVTEQGRGTFVALEPPRPPANQTATLLDLIDEAIIQAQALGVPAAAFARTAYARAKLFSATGADIRLLFSECNQVDTAYYARRIQEGTGIQPEIFLLDELRACEPDFFDRFDLLVTTIFHATELQELVGTERTVIGLMVEPSYLEVMAEIGRLPRGTKVGLVCASLEGAEQMERALVGVGVTVLEFIAAGVDQPEEMERLFGAADRIYVSRLGLSQKTDPWPTEKPVREYADELDEAALRLLRRQIAQVRVARAKAEDQVPGT
jgi:GntR family transcriptional regulator